MLVIHPACRGVPAHPGRTVQTYSAASVHPASLQHLSLPEPVFFGDGIRVQVLEQSLYEETSRVFASIWLRDNVLYREMRVTEEDFQQYIYTILLQRAQVYPLTCVIAHDMTTKPPKIVAVSFVQDLYGDVMPRFLFEDLSPSIRTILSINDDAIKPFQVNPVFSHLRRPGRVVYGLHAGTIPSYVNRQCDAGVFGKMTVTSRLLAFQAQAFWERGYSGIIGVATHPEAVKRSEARHMLNAYDIIVAKVEYKSWSYQESTVDKTRRLAQKKNARNKLGWNEAERFRKIAFSETKPTQDSKDTADKYYPFAKIKNPPYCVVIYESFPTWEDLRSSL